jgi:hypothetical protein
MFTTRITRWPCAVLAATTLQLAACSGDDGSSGVTGAAARGTSGFGSAYPAPPSLVNVLVGGHDLQFWPFTAGNLNGDPSDPINLVFQGEPNPVAIRGALMALDGDRTAYGMPNVAPFNCTWSDAIGDVQATWAQPTGWAGSAIQLACGDYAPMRFHVRLFDVGSHLVGNAHFEVLIPGTADHQVLSWELAEQLVTVDLMRTGLLDATAPVTPTAQINPAPTWRTIPAIIYNGLPVELRGLIGGPLSDQSTDVGIANNGSATLFNVARHYTGPMAGSVQDFTLTYGQVIPKPFCAPSPIYLYAAGPVHLRQTVQVTTGGKVIGEFRAVGSLQLTPVDPSTGQPSGETYSADVREQHGFAAGGDHNLAESFLRQAESPVTGPDRGVHVALIKVSSDGAENYQSSEKCGR